MPLSLLTWAATALCFRLVRLFVRAGVCGARAEAFSDQLTLESTFS